MADVADKKPESKQKVLEDLLKRRDTVQNSIQRVKGRLDSARQELKTVDEECVRRKVPPDQLEESIRRLDEKFEVAVVALQTKIETAEVAVAPYMKEEA